MNARSTLLESVRSLLERTYRIESGLAEIGPFVIGDLGYRRLYASRQIQHTADSAGPSRATTLVRQTAEGVLACIYFPDELIRSLESYPPQDGVSDANVEEFAAFVEEIDHLLLVAERARLERSVTLFEMELHANVSKYLVLSRFLAGRTAQLVPAARLWLRRRLFQAGTFCDEDAAVVERYRDAAHWAVRLLDGLSELEPAPRIEALRRFHAAAAPEKLELIRRLAA